jgi:hypothetical protein
MTTAWTPLTSQRSQEHQASSSPVDTTVGPVDSAAVGGSAAGVALVLLIIIVGVALCRRRRAINTNLAVEGSVTNENEYGVLPPFTRAQSENVQAGDPHVYDSPLSALRV